MEPNQSVLDLDVRGSLIHDLPKMESLKGDKASKNGNVTKNHRLKNELNVMHFHEVEV